MIDVEYQLDFIVGNSSRIGQTSMYPAPSRLRLCSCFSLFDLTILPNFPSGQCNASNLPLFRTPVR
jgi:hypothetical protein